MRALSQLVLVALIASACATSPGTRPEQVVRRGESGFTITEKVSAGMAVRSSFKRALRLLAEERYEEGIRLLEQVVEEAPNLTAAHIDLAIAYRHTGDLDSAEQSLTRALELSPRHPVAYNELGIVYRRMGRFEEARASYEEALERYPDFHFARRNLAILCDLYLSDPACALEHYERYVQAAPDDADAAMWVADLRNRAGR
jgi:tetratricopeptide (TPR) repeat protein